MNRRFGVSYCLPHSSTAPMLQCPTYGPLIHRALCDPFFFAFLTHPATHPNPDKPTRIDFIVGFISIVLAWVVLVRIFCLHNTSGSIEHGKDHLIYYIFIYLYYRTLRIQYYLIVGLKLRKKKISFRRTRVHRFVSRIPLWSCAASLQTPSKDLGDLYDHSIP